MGDEIKKFATAIGAKEPNPGDKNYKLFRQVFRRSNYFILDGKFAIIKISRTAKPFWGVGKAYLVPERKVHFLSFRAKRETLSY